MASYKDSPNLKFSPYVQTLPVEAMAKVGMYKQERYDQGVQKIQQSIDNVAGLDIARPEDKQYLQSKLNQLGSQLSMVAGGDFSNFALVNSVNGMTNQIVKDPRVMRDVSNTAKYKKDLTNVEKLNTEGKWAPSNQAAFQKDVNKWFQGGEDANYSSNISPYVDVTKESVNIIKALASKVTTNDVAVEQDSKGNYVIYDAITRRKVEGISKERIATALKTGLSPQAYRQLAIDGQYKYSGTSPDQYISDINSTYQKNFTELTAKREELTSVLNSLSPSQQTQVNQRIEEIDRAAVQLKQEYDSLSSGFENGDVENSQAQYYTMNFLENTSNAYASKTESTTYHTSPFKTQDNFERNMQQTQDNWETTHKLKVKEYNLKVEKERREREDQGLFGDLTLPTDAANNLTDAEVMQDALSQTNVAIEKVDSLKLKMDNLKITDAEINDPSIVQDTNKRVLIEQYKQAEKLKNRLVLRGAGIDEMANEVVKLPTKEETITAIPSSKKFIYGDDGTGNLLYHTIGDGEDSIDVYDLSELITKFDELYSGKVYGTSVSGVSTSTRIFPKEKAKKELTPLEYNLYEMYIDPDKKQVDVGYNTVNNNNILYRDQFNDFIQGGRDVNKIIKNKRDEQDSWKEKQYVKQRNINLVKTSSIDEDNFNDVTKTVSQLIQLANSADSGRLPTELQEGDIGSADEMSAILKEGIKTASVYTDQTDNQQGLIINNKRIPIPADQFNEITRGAFEPSPERKYYQNEVMPLLLNTLPKMIQVDKKDARGNVVRDVNGNIIKETVTKPRGYYTTSIDGEYDVAPWNSQYSTSSGSFPQLKDSYSVHLNFNSIQEPQDTDYVVAQMLVVDPLDKTPKTLNFTMTPERISEFFNLQDSNGRPALEQLIYGTLNRTAIDRGEMAKNINDEKGYKLLLKNQSEKLDN